MVSRIHSGKSQVIVYGLHFLLIGTYLFELFIILPRLHGKDVWTKNRYAHVIAGKVCSCAVLNRNSKLLKMLFFYTYLLYFVQH